MVEIFSLMKLALTWMDTTLGKPLLLIRNWYGRAFTEAMVLMDLTALIATRLEM